MSLFLVLLWCTLDARDVLRQNSRFGGFNSRLGANKFPFGRVRELPAKDLICLRVSGAKTALFGHDRENSRFHGNNREIAGASIRRYPAGARHAGGGRVRAQKDRENRPGARRAFDFEKPAMVIEDVFHDRQTEPRTAHLA